MLQVFPAMNTLWFWFKKQTRRQYHGTPYDATRKFKLLESAGLLQGGFEIFLIPSRIREENDFTADFTRRFSALDYRSVHIGDGDPDFLDKEQAYDDLCNLCSILNYLEVHAVVLHAHHLQNNRQRRRDLLLAALPGIQILIENNGFDNEWGGTVAALKDIFKTCPQFYWCLDIAHVKDFPRLSLHYFISEPALLSRLRQIHFSYSAVLCDADPYAEAGYPGYGPYHALFAVLGRAPSAQTREFVLQYPVILEGILPKEDKNFEFLKQEVDLLRP